jgi:2-keto-4-pentenoate hydratase
VRGLRVQLARRRERLEAGETPLGWKIGFGSPAALERLALAGPLLGFLLEEARVPPGAPVAVGGWTRPVAEPEVAVYLGADVPPGSRPGEVAAAVAGLGPAFELADVEFPPDDVEAILAANVYQRAVVLGPRGTGGADEVTALAARLLRGGREWAATDEPERLTGPVLGLVGHAADLLGAFGERLCAGDVLIAGSVVPPLDVVPGDRLRFELEPLGAVEVSLVG